MTRTLARRHRLTAAAAVVAVLLTACGSESDPADAGAPTSTGAPASTAFPAMTIDVTDDEALAAMELLNKALLAPEDLGGNFTRSGYTPADPTDHASVLPCGQANTAALFPNALRTGTTLVDDIAQLQQSANLFLDTTAASGAYLSAVNGYACETAMVGDTEVTITDQGDVAAATGADQAHAWTALIGAERGVLFTVQVRNITMNFTFVLGVASGETDLPDPVDLVATAVTKMRASGL